MVLQILQKPTIQKTPKSKAFWIKDSILVVQDVQMPVLSNRRVSLYLEYMDIHTLGSYRKIALKSGWKMKLESECLIQLMYNVPLIRSF